MVKWVAILGLVIGAAFWGAAGCEQRPSVPPAAAFTPTAADVEGVWVVHPDSLKDAAHNAALKRANELGVEPDEELLKALTEKVFEATKDDGSEMEFKSGSEPGEKGGVLEMRRKGRSWTGTWALVLDKVTVDVPSLGVPRRYRVVEGGLISIPLASNGREVVLKRK